MEEIRVLVLDKNIILRQAFASLLNKEPDVAVRVSENISDSEKLVRDESPHAVFLDIEDAASDGYSIFNILRVRFPGLPIVVISPRSKKGAKAAMYAIRRGAVDVITKPKKNSALLFASRHFEKRLPPIIRGIERVIGRGTMEGESSEKNTWHYTGVDQEKHSDKERDSLNKKSTSLIVIGGGMGGPEAIANIISGLPADFSIPIVAVQHFPKLYTKALAQELAKISPLAVREVTDGTELKAGSVWMAPGGWHCEIKQAGNRSVIKVHRGPRENEMRPSIDVLFRSVARIYGSRALGIILSGNGVDGLAGARAIREKEGDVIVQDPGNAMVDDLPLSVIRESLANQHYPADEIGTRILRNIAEPKKTMQIQKYYDFNLLKKDPGYFNTV